MVCRGFDNGVVGCKGCNMALEGPYSMFNKGFSRDFGLREFLG